MQACNISSSTDNIEPEGRKLEYWQMNTKHPIPTFCPSYLQNLSAKNIRILQTRDCDFTPLTWGEVKDHVAHQRLDVFWRKPSHQRRYLEFCWNLKKRTSMSRFILEERLRWTVGETFIVGRFDNPHNVAIKKNDWPYGIIDEIVHLVIWTKFSLHQDAETGHLTKEGTDEVAAYVERQFCVAMPKNHVSYKEGSPIRNSFTQILIMSTGRYSGSGIGTLSKVLMRWNIFI